MKAVILVGGEGTRLRPLTCNTAKAMVPLLNRPFLEYLILYLKRHGVNEIILSTGYLPSQLQSYFADGARLGVRLTYVTEAQPLGTAGAIKNAEPFLDGTFLVVNGDILTGIDLKAMVGQHQRAKPAVSIALTPVDDPTAYGVVETNAQGMVKRFTEKPKREEVTTNMVNAGIYILEPEVLGHIPPSAPYTLEHHLFPRLLGKDVPILGYPSDAYWIDIGTPEKYLKVQHDLLTGRAPTLSTYHPQISRKSQIHPSALVNGPVLIGEGCVIARGAAIKGPALLGAACEVNEEAVVDGAVIWHHSKIGPRTVLKNCIIGTGCDIGEDCWVEDNSVIGDNVTVGRGSNLGYGTKVWPDRHIGSDTST